MGRRILAWVLVLSLLSSNLAWAAPAGGSGRGTPAHAATAEGAPLPPMPSLAPPATLDLVAVRDGAFAVADRYAPSRFFVPDLTAALDHKPEAAFAHVRDRIRFDPYRGILRGVEGTLGAQAGNAYDRSLLLQRLLDDMGLETRLAFGTLPESQARVLLARALQPAPDPIDPEPLERLAGFLPLVRQRLEARATRDYEWLRGSGALTGTHTAGRLVGLEDVRDHVWVQARIEGKWTDLDASFADAVPGRSYAEAGRYALEAPAADNQMIELALVAEALDGAALVERRVLEHALPAFSGAASTVYLSFSPKNPSLGGTLARALGAQDELVPTLTVDGVNVVGQPLPGISADASVARDFLGGPVRAELTAVFLEVRTSNQGVVSTSRRCLLDRLPSRARIGTPDRSHLRPVARVRSAPAFLFSVHQILISTGGQNPHRTANDVGLAAHFAGRYMSDEKVYRELPLDSVMWPIAMMRALWLAVNERRSVEAANDRSDVRLLIGQPRVFVASIAEYEHTSRPELAISLDLLHDVPVVVSAEGVAPREVAARRARYGVWQSAFETTLAELGRQALGDGAEGLLSASLQTGGASVVITSSREPGVPGDAPTMLLQQLDAGQTVVVSEMARAGGVRTWWALSSDGTVRAMLAPSLGGIDDSYWFTRFTKVNLFANNPTVYTPNREWACLSNPKCAAEWRRMQQQTLNRAYQKGGGRVAAERASRASRLPQTQRSGGGGTEYQIVLNISIWSHGLTSIGLGMTLLALGTVAFAAVYAYLINLDIERRTK